MTCLSADPSRSALLRSNSRRDPPRLRVARGGRDGDRRTRSRRTSSTGAASSGRCTPTVSRGTPRAHVPAGPRHGRLDRRRHVLPPGVARAVRRPRRRPHRPRHGVAGNLPPPESGTRGPGRRGRRPRGPPGVRPAAGGPDRRHGRDATGRRGRTGRGRRRTPVCGYSSRIRSARRSASPTRSSAASFPVSSTSARRSLTWPTRLSTTAAAAPTRSSATASAPPIHRLASRSVGVVETETIHTSNDTRVPFECVIAFGFCYSSAVAASSACRASTSESGSPSALGSRSSAASGSRPPSAPCSRSSSVTAASTGAFLGRVSPVRSFS